MSTTCREAPGVDPWALLVRRMAGGDEEALAALYDQASRTIYGVVRRILWNPSDVDEVTAEVFAKAWRSADTYEDRLGSAAAWLITMARNGAVDALRRQRREGPTDSLDNALSLAAATGDPEEHAGREMRDRRLRQALGVLGPVQRETIELAFFGGLSHVEIANRLGLPIGTVKTRIRLAVKKLRAALDDAGDLGTGGCSR